MAEHAGPGNAAECGAVALAAVRRHTRQLLRLAVWRVKELQGAAGRANVRARVVRKVMMVHAAAEAWW